LGFPKIIDDGESISTLKTLFKHSSILILFIYFLPHSNQKTTKLFMLQ